MSAFRYPCTGQVSIRGFGAFLEDNIQTSRHNLTQFGAALCNRFGAGQLTLVNSGSSANLVAALALAEKLKEKGKPLEAVAAAFTFPTTLSALALAGFNIRLVDTEAGGFNLCPDALAADLARAPASLVCVTHFLGFPAQMDKIMPLARAAGALVLQDACETMELKDGEGRPMHALGDLSTWSFYHPHHFSSYGGGAVIATDAELHRICDSLAHWGRACTCHINPAFCAAPKGAGHQFTYVRTGVNVEMSELNACFGRFQLERWEEIEAGRKERYGILYEALEGVRGLKVYPAPDNQGSPFVFPVTCQDLPASLAVSMLAEKGVECRTLMGGAMIDQPAFKALPHDGNRQARAMAASSFFVGIHQTLPLEDVREVGQLVREVLTSQRVRKYG